jgi:exopolyphosphatase/guanosine-5'-triphosphate,3'-diphosphate pyrophosphatase
MDALEVDELQLCPWALREGVILSRLDQLTASLPRRRADHDH